MPPPIDWRSLDVLTAKLLAYDLCFPYSLTSTSPSHERKGASLTCRLRDIQLTTSRPGALPLCSETLVQGKIRINGSCGEGRSIAELRSVTGAVARSSRPLETAIANSEGQRHEPHVLGTSARLHSNHARLSRSLCSDPRPAGTSR